MQHNCPHCGFEKEADGFDAIDEGVMHECRCEDCGNSYMLYFIECEACFNDSVFSWTKVPSPVAVQQLSCECCAHTLHPNFIEHSEHAF
jgi:hypothetical protein